MPMSKEELDNWQSVLAAQRQDLASTTASSTTGKPSGFELWHLLLILLALAALAESLLGNTYVFRRVETPT